ncbi:enoyl-CoA hydratase-related protein [Streptomyces sp. NPDC048845]|uniref:enoyl-CoA hydratase-related protein n=1 Tax=Streptomyces sp. NPDC048845 TaxID=3155390 RepID=UPI003416707B
MHVLLVASAFDSLTQRILTELRDRGHTTDTAVAGDEEAVRRAVHRYAPELLIAPRLDTVIPEDVWSARTCLVVHLGPPGDRGPSPLDRACRDGVRRWGVTVHQATGELGAGDVWSWVPFTVPPVGKGDLYRNEAADAATEAVLLAVRRFASGGYRPRPQTEAAERIVHRPHLTQELRRVDWERDDTATVLRSLRSADSHPGVLDDLLGRPFYLHGGHHEDRLRGRPGELLATRAGAVCRATTDGAVWIPELRPRRTPGGPATFRLPAVQALGSLLPDLPEVHAPLRLPAHRRTWTDISYAENGPVGFLRFSFPGGAMSTAQCRRLLAAYRFACHRPVSVIVLGGARDFFACGVHLRVIEAAADPGKEAWANTNALNDLVQAVLTTTDRLVVAAVGGNAAAGGAMLALAADEVWCRSGSVLAPYTRPLGKYGSAYRTYVLPRRAGEEAAAALVDEAQPLGAAGARRAGLVDRVLAVAPQDFGTEIARLAGELGREAGLPDRIAAKKAARERDEALRPLSAYQQAEMERVRRAFFTPDDPYHALRAAIVRRTEPAAAVVGPARSAEPDSVPAGT